MSSSGKLVKSGAGQSFIVKEGSWLRTYDKNCKKISEKSA